MILLLLFFFSLFFSVQLLLAGVPGAQVVPAAHCQGGRCTPANAAAEAADVGLEDTQIIPRP